MLGNQCRVFAVTLLALVVATPLSSTRADAFPGGGVRVPVSTVIAKEKSDPLVLARHRHGHRYYPRYNRHYHGRRYKYRRDGYSHFYGGYFYAWPWWYNSLYYYPRRTYAYGAHERWCLNRYRSYNPRTDMYLGYDGRYHYCNSPYD